MSIFADTAIINSNIITMSAGQPKAQALAIKQGKFISVGRNEEVQAAIGSGTCVMDLKGETIIPGLIDAHLHVLNSGIYHVIAEDCDLRSISQIQSALHERCLMTPPGEWVRGFKFDDTKTSDGRSLNRQDLDLVSLDHPIFIVHRSEHTFYVNSKALEIAGITKDTSDPVGGKFEHDGQTGELNGVVQDLASSYFERFFSPVNDDDRRQGLKLIMDMFSRSGLTSVHDALVTNLDLKTYQDSLASGDLTLRVYLLMDYPFFESLHQSGIRTGFGNDQLRIGGIKLMTDGAIASRTAWLSQPYINSDDRGIRLIDPEELEERVLRIHRAGFQVCSHANGDAAIDMTLTAYEKAISRCQRPGARHRIEHCTLVNPSLLERIKKLGVIVTPFCTYVYYHGEKMKFYGEERLQWMFAQRSFLDYGIISTGATDYVPGPFEPLLGIQSCVTRADSSGKVWGKTQKITVEEALRIYTLHGAIASFEEYLKGSIEVGKLADLVVLGADPTSVDPYSIKDIPILQTVVAGRVVFVA